MRVSICASGWNLEVSQHFSPQKTELLHYSQTRQIPHSLVTPLMKYMPIVLVWHRCPTHTLERGKLNTSQPDFQIIYFWLQRWLVWYWECGQVKPLENNKPSMGERFSFHTWRLTQHCLMSHYHLWENWKQKASDLFFKTDNSSLLHTTA